MTSAKIFVFEGVSKENFQDIFQDHDIVVDKIEEFNFDLRETVEEYSEISNYDVSFTFQTDFKFTKELRGRVFPYPAYYRSDIWIYFTDRGNYMFIFDKDRPSKYISGRIRDILSKNEYNVEIERLKISNEALLRIVSQDFVRINSSWWKEIGEDLRTAFLSGRLRDTDGENELYRLIEERAGEITVANYLSRKLGFSILISRKKGSIATGRRNVDPSVIVNYFKDVIHPILLQMP